MSGGQAFGAAGMEGPAAAVRACGLDPDETLPFLRQIMSEDVGSGDITSNAVIPPAISGEFAVVANSPGILAGAPLAAAIFWIQDRRLGIELPIADGTPVDRGDILLTVAGSVRSILAAERVALNLLGRLSGIASLTARFVAQIAASRARVLDTRKTGLGTRRIDKYAVRCGGGTNHRVGLFDAVLVKDNHIAASGSIAAAVARLQAVGREAKSIEVECDTIDQVAQCLELGVGRILLDNMDTDQLAAAVRMNRRRSELEASGGITLQTAAAVAASGVDYLSVGAITHSAPALDVGLNALPGPAT